MEFLEFAMKYEKSRHPLLRLLAGVCMRIAKKKAERIEKKAEEGPGSR